MKGLLIITLVALGTVNAVRFQAHQRMQEQGYAYQQIPNPFAGKSQQEYRHEKETSSSEINHQESYSHEVEQRSHSVGGAGRGRRPFVIPPKPEPYHFQCRGLPTKQAVIECYESHLAKCNCPVPPNPEPPCWCECRDGLWNNGDVIPPRPRPPTPSPPGNNNGGSLIKVGVLGGNNQGGKGGLLDVNVLGGKQQGKGGLLNVNVLGGKQEGKGGLLDVNVGGGSNNKQGGGLLGVKLF